MTTESFSQSGLDSLIPQMSAQFSMAQVTSVTSAAPDKAYRNEGFLEIVVEFDQPVTVTGMPTLTLETGKNDAVALYGAGTGTNQLMFVFVILPNLLSPDLDYTGTSALKLNGGTIKDLSGNDVSLTLPAPGTACSLGANKAIVIDSTPPEIVSAVVAGREITISFNEHFGGPGWFLFSENWNVTVDGQPAKLWATGRTESRITLTLKEPVQHGQSVSVSFSGVSIIFGGIVLRPHHP